MRHRGLGPREVSSGDEATRISDGPNLGAVHEGCGRSPLYDHPSLTATSSKRHRRPLGMSFQAFACPLSPEISKHHLTRPAIFGAAEKTSSRFNTG